MFLCNCFIDSYKRYRLLNLLKEATGFKKLKPLIMTVHTFTVETGITSDCHENGFHNV